MPLLKHAKKKQRQDIRKERVQKNIRVAYKELIKKAKLNPTPEAVSAAFQGIDKAAKKNLIHDNKAGRLKSALSKAMSGKPATQAPTAKKHLTKAALAKANKSISKAPVAEVTPVVAAPEKPVKSKKTSPKKK